MWPFKKKQKDPVLVTLVKNTEVDGKVYIHLMFDGSSKKAWQGEEEEKAKACFTRVVSEGLPKSEVLLWKLLDQ